jgi:hypothetical protein
MAERMGETLLRSMALANLSLTALRRHDTEAVRALLPRSFAATRALGGDIGSRKATSLAISAWLAAQDGRPDEVLRLAAEVEAHDLDTIGSGGMSRWVYLFPVMAARLGLGESEAAVDAARRIIDRDQQVLPDDLAGVLTEACASWDEGDPEGAARRLTEALAVARGRDYF